MLNNRTIQDLTGGYIYYQYMLDGRENYDVYWIQKAITVSEESILFWASWI